MLPAVLDCACIGPCYHWALTLVVCSTNTLAVMLPRRDTTCAHKSSGSGPAGLRLTLGDAALSST